MQLRFEIQRNPVADEVSAITAVVRPILLGVLYGLKREVAEQAGGYEGLKLFMLARSRKPGDGDCGICFEYAVHDAVTRGDAMVLDRIDNVLTRDCRILGSRPESILFGVEKAGTQQLIETAKDLLTPESLLMAGTRGAPVRLKKHIDAIAGAFRRGDKANLPQSIAGLWKADLFLGKADADRWVGTTVKINASDLEGARGLRIGIVPSRQGVSDSPWKDERRNLIVCPLPHDGSFMEVFYSGWGVVQQFLAADARIPKEAALPRPAHRQVARWLEERRDHPVVDVVDVLGPLAQPELLDAGQRAATVVGTSGAPELIVPEVGTVIAPLPRPIFPSRR